MQFLTGPKLDGIKPASAALLVECMHCARFRPPPRAHYPPRPIGATLGTAMNNFNSSHKKVFEYYITWLFYFFAWFWTLGALSLPPWGPHVPYERLWIADPYGWFLPSLLSDQAFSSSRWNSYFYIGPPPQPVTRTGAIGATIWTIFILHLRRSIHTK